MARPGFTKHWKFHQLCEALGLPEPFVLGLMEMMWQGCYEAGDDVLGSRAAVDRAARWPGERGVFAAAVIEAQLVDEEGGVCRVHDLLDHAPAYVVKRMHREAERRAHGTSLREIRAAAGRKGYEAMLAGKEEAPNRQTDAISPANGDQLPGKRSASERPPAPAPAPAPIPLSVTRNGSGNHTVVGATTTAAGTSGTEQPALPGLEDRVVLRFPVTGGKKAKPGEPPAEWELRASLVAELQASYPDFDVPQMLRSAHANVMAGNRKTAQGMRRFLVSWINRDVAKGNFRKVGAGARGRGGGQAPFRTPEAALGIRARGTGPELDRQLDQWTEKLDREEEPPA